MRNTILANTYSETRFLIYYQYIILYRCFIYIYINNQNRAAESYAKYFRTVRNWVMNWRQWSPHNHSVLLLGKAKIRP